VVAAARPAGGGRGGGRGGVGGGGGAGPPPTALLGAAVATPVFSLVIPAGPLLLCASTPVLVGLVILDQTEDDA
jgi:hypothetical protein